MLADARSLRKASSATDSRGAHSSAGARQGGPSWRALRRPARSRVRSPDAQIELLKTFADQAVIAHRERAAVPGGAARTEALTRSVEEMRALGEVGQAVSSTLDLQTVLLTIITHAVELSKADAGGTIYEFDEASRSVRAASQLSA